jgi:hypothetical protein
MPYYRTFCGCYHVVPSSYIQKQYLPLAESSFHTTLFSNVSRTVLNQTFWNTNDQPIERCHYTFPLYDGVSVVDFTCRIKDRTIAGVVKEKKEAKAVFDQAVSEGKSAALLEQSEYASDVFTTSLGNVGPKEKIEIEITYIGELKNDLDIDGVRLTIPTVIAPRYGYEGHVPQAKSLPAVEKSGIKIVVDVSMPDGNHIRSLESPSHPISISLGKLSTMSESEDMSLTKASATLSLGETELEKDFVLLIRTKGNDSPSAWLEIHPDLKNHRALMTTLVPKFSLPSCLPEIVFIVDRSGSMDDNIQTVVDAMRVFLKSLPAGVKYNICSFGSTFSFLWQKSNSYTKNTLKEALNHLDTFSANLGGTETLSAIQATVENRYQDLPLEMILLTDGDIWAQQQAFSYVHEQVSVSNGQIRLFPLGIGNGVSHSLIEGLARSGNGFAQSIQNGERLDTRVMRMLKGALSPHITDYQLEIKYEKDDDDDFEWIESVSDGLKVMVLDDELGSSSVEGPSKKQKTISLFDPTADPDKPEPASVENALQLPNITTPKILQAPHQIPSLFPFSRTTAYILMSPDTIQRKPTSVVFKATSVHGPLELEIPIDTLDKPGKTIHQLAARKAVQDLEEGRGWIHDATDEKGNNIKASFESRFPDLVQREAVRLGTKFQVANKWCSFVAVDEKTKARIEKQQRQSKSSDEKAEIAAYQPPSFHISPDEAAESEEDEDEDYCCEEVTYTEVDSLDTVVPSPGGRGGIGGGFRGGGSRGGSFTKSRARRAVPHQYSYSGSPPLPPPPPAASAAPLMDMQLQLMALSQQTHAANSNMLRAQWSPSSAPKKVSTTNLTTGTSLFRAIAPESLINKVFKRNKRSYKGSKTTSSNSNSTLPITTTTTIADKIHRLINLQDFGGFWPVDCAREISALLGVRDPRAITSYSLPPTATTAASSSSTSSSTSGKDAQQQQAQKKHIFTTILVLVFLQEQAASEKELWEFVVEKAQRWADACVASLAAGAGAGDGQGEKLLKDVTEKAREVLKGVS